MPFHMMLRFSDFNLGELYLKVAAISEILFKGMRVKSLDNEGNSCHGVQGASGGPA